MAQEIENEMREPSIVEWLYDIAARSEGMRVEACQTWDAARQIDEKQVDGPTAESISGLQGRLAKGEHLFQGSERKMDKLENNNLEELDEKITEGDMSKNKRMADAWSETEQLMREIRRSNGGDEHSENVRSKTIGLFKTMDDGKDRLNDVINNPEKQDVSDSEAEMSIVTYEQTQDAVALGGVEKPVLDEINEAELIAQMQNSSNMNSDEVYASEFGNNTEAIVENANVNPKFISKISQESLYSVSETVQESAEDTNPDKADDVEDKEELQKLGLDKEELEKNDDGDALVKVLVATRV